MKLMKQIGGEEALAHVFQEDKLGRPALVLGEILLGRVEHLFEHLGDSEIVVARGLGVFLRESAAGTLLAQIEGVSDGFVKDNGVWTLHEGALKGSGAGARVHPDDDGQGCLFGRRHVDDSALWCGRCVMVRRKGDGANEGGKDGLALGQVS